MPNLPIRNQVSEAQLARAMDSVGPMSQDVREARERAGEGAFTVVWLGDLHLHAQRDYGSTDLSLYRTHVDTSANLRLALAEVSALRPAPDIVVFGGDLADSGCDGEAPGDEYEELKAVLDECLDSKLITLPLMGNHDHADRPLSHAFHETYRRVRSAGWPEPVEQEDFYHEVTLDGWRFIALDSRQGKPLSDRQRAWLSSRLEGTEALPTVVLAHRPFVSVGNWVDNHRLVDRASFDLIDGAASVRAVCSGHTHKSTAWQYHRKIHVVFPAIAYGIGDTCGWGCVVLGKESVPRVFVKELAMKTFEIVAGEERERTGGSRVLETPLYENSELCDPCLLPWREDPTERD